MYLPKDDSFPCYEGVGRASRGVAPELDEVSKRLLAAAEIIRERGWCQNTAHAQGRVCLRQAIVLAHGRELFDWSVDDHAELERVSNAIGKPLTDQSGTYTAVLFNDAPETTKEKVIEALTLAAQPPRSGGFPMILFLLGIGVVKPDLRSGDRRGL